jgi:CHASE3 domain sensor protein
MDIPTQSSQFQQVIEEVEALPEDDQMLLVEIIHQRLIQHRRLELVAEVAEARQAYRAGDARRGTVDELLVTIGGHDEVY